MSAPDADRWLLPRQQTEYPTRDLLPEAKLHGRREATFLVLATVFIASLAALVTSPARELDLSVVLPDVDLPVSMRVAIGVIPAALGFAAVALVCELFGRRRAAALVGAGALAAAVLVLLAWLGGTRDHALALASYAIGAH